MNIILNMHKAEIKKNGIARLRQIFENGGQNKEVSTENSPGPIKAGHLALPDLEVSEGVDAKVASHLDENLNVNDVKIEVHPETTYPHDVWLEYLGMKLVNVENVTPTDPESKVGKNCLRFVCMSDTHGLVENTDFYKSVPDGDVLLHTGDFTMNGTVEEFEKFNSFLGRLPHKIKLVIPGNHEITLDPRGYEVNERTLRKRLGLPMNPPKDNPNEHINHMKALLTNAKVLIDEQVEICGIKIYGVPWVPQYGVSGFGLTRGYELLAKYNKIPAGIDILMSHGPALGFCDLTQRNKHVGCVELHNSVRKRIKPKYVVSGHIHEGYGMQTDGSTIYINAAACNKNYRPIQRPVVFDFPLPHQRDCLAGRCCCFGKQCDLL